MCIALAFFCALFLPAVRTDAIPPPSLRIVSSGLQGHEGFEEALMSRLAARAGWRIESGGPLPNRPCGQGDPRAALDIRFPPAPDGLLTADAALTDCAAWPVKNWSFTRPATVIGERALAGDILFALRLWQHAEPSRFAALFDTGDADGRAKGCRPELGLAKTSDGKMRVIVRAGGPAYASGLRSNDVVERIDGRDWWEYGTYRSQQRAVDGKTHSYMLSESKSTFTVPCPGPPPTM